MPVAPRVLALFLVCATCFAADDTELSQRRDRLKHKWEAQFRAADTDGDRLLSRAEIQAGGLPEALSDQFDEIDLDHDKALSPQELWVVHEKRLQAQRRGSGPPR